MRSFPTIAVLRSIAVHHRELVVELARREVADRYAGSFLGGVWAIATPLATMSIYVGLFAFVFPVRLGLDGSPWMGACLILSGLVPWLAFVDVAVRAPSILVSQRALVRQVIFPVETLPAKSVASSLVGWAVGTVVTLSIALVANGFKTSWILLPLLWGLQLLAMFGTACLLAAAGAWIRDLREVVSILSNIGLYLAPILLLPATIASLPRVVQWLIAANPFSHMVWCYQDAIVHGGILHPASWVVFPILAIAALVGGTLAFSFARGSMAEVL